MKETYIKLVLVSVLQAYSLGYILITGVVLEHSF